METERQRQTTGSDIRHVGCGGVPGGGPSLLREPQRTVNVLLLQME